MGIKSQEKGNEKKRYDQLKQTASGAICNNYNDGFHYNLHNE